MKGRSPFKKHRGRPGAAGPPAIIELLRIREGIIKNFLYNFKFFLGKDEYTGPDLRSYEKKSINKRVFIYYVHMQIEVPEISKNELTPISIKLLNIIDQYVQIIEQKNVLIRQLKDENARLKGGNPRPKLKPSTLERNNIDTANNVTAHF